MITNYKVNQPFTSDFSARKERKFQSHLNWVSWSRQKRQPCWNLFYAEDRKVSGRKTIQSQHWKPILSGLDRFFFLVPFKESRFPLYGISIQAGKQSSSSITERSCATGIDFFHKTQASNFQQRPWGPLCSKSAGSECSRKFCKFGMI